VSPQTDSRAPHPKTLPRFAGECLGVWPRRRRSEYILDGKVALITGRRAGKSARRTAPLE